MVNIKSLTGPMLKRELNIKKAYKRFHNRNRGGGSFAFELSTRKYPEFKIYGHHDIDGEITNLEFAKLWQPGDSYMEPEPTIIIDCGNRKTITLDYAIEQIKLGMNNVKH